MRKLIRVLIGLAVVFVLVVVAVRLFLPADKIQDFLFHELESRTGLHAQAEKASIQFPWPVGLRLEGLKVTAPGGTKGGIPRLNCEVESALARAEFFSLLRRKPQVQEIRLERPRLEIWMPQAHESTAAPGAAVGSGKKSPPQSMVSALALGLLSIDDGKLILHQADASTVTVEGLNQSAHFQLDATGHFAGRLDSKIDSLLLEGGGRARPQRLEQLQAEIEVAGTSAPLLVRAQIARLSASGLSVKGPFEYREGPSRPSVDTELQWELDPDELRTRLKASAPAKLGEWDLQVKSVSGTLQAKGELPAPSAEPSAWLALVRTEGHADGVSLSALGKENLASGAMNFVQHGDQITVDLLKIQLSGASLSGRISVPALGKGQAKGTLRIERAQLGELESLLTSVWSELPDSLVASASPPAQWPQLRGNLTGTLEVNLPLPQPPKLPATAVKGEFALGRIAIAAQSLQDSLILRGGTISATTQSAELKHIAVSSDGLEGTVDGTLDGWPQRYRFRGNANLALVDLDRLVKQSNQNHAQASGRWWKVSAARAQEKKEEFPAPPQNLELQMQLASNHFRSRGYEVENLRGQLDLRARLMKLSELKGSMGGGQLTGDGSVDWNKKPSSWKGHLEAQQVTASSLLAPFAPKLAEAFQSSFSGMMTLSGPLSDDRKAILAALSGGGVLKGGAGEFLTSSILGEELAKLPGKAAEKLRDLPFKEFLAQIRIEAGKAHFDQAILKGPTQLKADGWAGFDGTVDYKLELKLPPGESLDLGSLTPLTEFLREADGRITVPIHVSGSGSKPQVSLELGVAEKRAKDAVNQNLGNKLQDLLKGLGKKKGGG